MSTFYSSPAELLDVLLDNGLILPPSENICCPPCTEGPYILSSVETFLKFAEAAGETSACCFNVAATVETFLKLEEGWNGPICENDSSFSDCVAEIENLLTASEYLDFLQKGLVELGHIAGDGSGGSYVCILATYLQSAFNLQTGSPATSLIEILLRIQDKGIVIQCIPDGFIMASVETYLKWAEAVG